MVVGAIFENARIVAVRGVDPGLHLVRITGGQSDGHGTRRRSRFSLLEVLVATTVITVAVAALAPGREVPARTVLVQSFSKSFGPDLRLAADRGA